MRNIKLITVLILFSRMSFSVTDCQSQILKILNRISPASKAIPFTVSNEKPIYNLNSGEQALTKLLKPEMKVQIINEKEIKFSVITPEEFNILSSKTEHHGFWSIFYPSGADARVASGHQAVLIGKSHFTRNVDESGPDSMVSAKDLHAAGIGKNEAVVVQFFETSPESKKALEKFFHDRVWFHHQKSTDYYTKYVPLPFTRDAKEHCAENCVSFTFPFYNTRWLQQRPELNQVAEELGNMRVSEIPSRQVFFNTQSQGYRGTLIIANDVTAAKNALMNGSFNQHPQGAQLLFDGPAQLSE